jgi:hypothetical protein
VIRCLACDSTIDAARDLLARRFVLGDAQRHAVTPEEFLFVITDATVITDEPLPVIDYSRSSFQHLYGCPSCLTIVQADRPARADDVVPGKLRIAVPGSVAVRALRRLTSAVAGGRVREEMRALAVDPVRRYVLRLPQVFRAVRPAFGEDAVLVADVSPVRTRDELASPHGLCWDDGPPVPEGAERLKRVVKRTVSGFEEASVALPLSWGKVAIVQAPATDPAIMTVFSRETRMPILGEEGAALRVSVPRVKPPRAARPDYSPTNGFVVTLDLVRPA